MTYLEIDYVESMCCIIKKACLFFLYYAARKKRHAFSSRSKYFKSQKNKTKSNIKSGAK